MDNHYKLTVKNQRHPKLWVKTSTMRSTPTSPLVIQPSQPNLNFKPSLSSCEVVKSCIESTFNINSSTQPTQPTPALTQLSNSTLQRNWLVPNSIKSSTPTAVLLSEVPNGTVICISSLDAATAEAPWRWELVIQRLVVRWL